MTCRISSSFVKLLVLPALAAAQILSATSLPVTPLASLEPLHEFAYTNKKAAHFTAAVDKNNSRKFQGFVIGGWSYVNNFILALDGADGVADQVHQEGMQLFPDRLVRTFMVRGGQARVLEEVFLADERDTLLVRYSVNLGGRVHFYPRFDIRPHWADEAVQSYRVVWKADEGILRVDQQGAPGSVAVAADVPLHFTPSASGEEQIPLRYARDLEIGGKGQGLAYQPGSLDFDLKAGQSVTFAFAVNASPEQAMIQAREDVAQYDKFLRQRQSRMTQLLAQVGGGLPTPIQSTDPRLDAAMNWAVLSSDALLMNLAGYGIIAGLHWFEEYWGRDMFIAMPGMLLVTGRFAEARAIINQSFQTQDRDPTSPTYGRIPNIVRPGFRIYNTADALPWLLRNLHEYVLYTGDLEFARQQFEGVRTAIAGESRRMDTEGFVLHGDQETWMDVQHDFHLVSQTIRVPFTPRGTRAVEVQALWYAALRGAANLAQHLGYLADAQAWGLRADALETSFQARFWNDEDGSLYDHLKADGTPDATRRPNVVFGITAPMVGTSWRSLIAEEKERSLLQDLYQHEIVVPWGVRSLAPGASFFNPFLAQLGPAYCNRYVCDGVIHYHPYMYHGSHQGMDDKDWAYHNGTVWPWLSGPVISALIKQGWMDQAWTLTRSLTEHLLTGATLGSLSELLDGDSSGNPIGWDKGAVSQAWSLAEYIRVLYQDYLGARVDMLNHEVRLAPRLPQSLPQLRAAVHAGENILNVSVTDHGRRVEVTPQKAPLKTPVRLRFSLPLGSTSSAFQLRVNDQEWSFATREQDGQTLAEFSAILDQRKSMRAELVPVARKD